MDFLLILGGWEHLRGCRGEGSPLHCFQMHQADEVLAPRAARAVVTGAGHSISFYLEPGTVGRSPVHVVSWSLRTLERAKPCP